MLHLTTCRVAEAPSGPPKTTNSRRPEGPQAPHGAEETFDRRGREGLEPPKRMTRARLVEFWHAVVNTALRHEAKSFLRQIAHDELAEHAARYITIARNSQQDSISALKMDVTIDILKASR